MMNVFFVVFLVLIVVVWFFIFVVRELRCFENFIVILFVFEYVLV